MKLEAAQWEQIKNLFESAIAHTPETRAQFLELTCSRWDGSTSLLPAHTIGVNTPATSMSLATTHV
jgi:hypothetical protein